MTGRTKHVTFLLGLLLLSAGASCWIFLRYSALWKNDGASEHQAGDELEPVLPAEISELMKKGEMHNAVLFNNAQGRLIDPETKTMKGDLAGLGTPVDPHEVMIIAEASVPEEMVNLYTSITRLPDTAEVVRILYTLSGDRKKATLLGYTVERPRGTEVAFVRYDGSSPWLAWITQSFTAVDAKR
jgi:hypothetical protein